MLHVLVTLKIMFDERLDAARSGDEGATAVEYGLMVALIAAGIAAVVLKFKGHITTMFNDTCNSVGSAAGPGTGGC